ncbi:NYN domain-containing protein [Paraburkholderia sp. J41]|uniref:NYN domain-containing protein n=1 Tax=Paraburkholderia sp. J41 TaxID=2805433 RepID=UPI002AC32318|nr:NYN domain-containing protein [Paraburkholderia sp. J41]
MASPQENVSMAVFCDFENVALGVRDAKFDRFDIQLVLERLLLKGSIVVKKAYCDWERYKGFKAGMHEASFELIEIPHVRQSGKNSADIRLVVDALDLCYTKSHVDTFVIVSGDSDFSPLVSKLRENAKKVIGVGVKHSTSDLLVANCDEFIFYDDLVRELVREQQARAKSKAESAKRGGDERQPKQDSEERKSKAVALAIETLDALVLERGESGKIWASVLKSAIKRRRPDFNETRYGFRAFGNLLEEAQSRGLLEVGRDDKSGTWVSRLNPPPFVAAANTSHASLPAMPGEESHAPRNDEPRGRRKGRRNGRGGAAQEAHEGHEGQEARELQPETSAEAQHEIAFEPAEAPARVYDAEYEESAHETTLPFAREDFDESEAHTTSRATNDAADPDFAPPARARKSASRKSPARKRTAQKEKSEQNDSQNAAPADHEATPAPLAEAPAEPASKAPAAKKTRARRPRSKPASDAS